MKIQSIKKISLFIALFASQAFASSPLPDLAASVIDNRLPGASEASEQVAALDALVNPELTNDMQVFAHLTYIANQLLKTTAMPNQDPQSALGQQLRIKKREALQYLMRYLLVRIDTQNFVLEINHPGAINPELEQAYQAAVTALIAFEAIEQPNPEQIWQFKTRCRPLWLAIKAQRSQSSRDAKVDFQALAQQLIEQVTPRNVYDRITALEVMLEFQQPLYAFEQQVFEFQLEEIDSQKAYFKAYSNDPTRVHSLETLTKIAQSNINKARKNGVMLEKSGIQSQLEHLSQVPKTGFIKDKAAFQHALAAYQNALQAVVEFRLSIQAVSTSL